MDRSIRTLPHPIADSAHGERRRSVRQKLHTPIYASFNGPQTGMVVDLSELLDLHEDGFAIQTGERLETNRAVTLCLDLPETKSYIHGIGQVIWSDDTGRGGIKFSTLSDGSRGILKEWLFANLLIACSNHAARAEQRACRKEENEENVSTGPAAVHESSPAVCVAHESGAQALSELELDLEIVRGKVRELGNDVDAILQLITVCAVSLTESSGAAMAFLADDNAFETATVGNPFDRSSHISTAENENVAHVTLICRARTGAPAPPWGARLDTQQGVSGECVRSGRLVSCEDTGNDERVDPDLCRSLGIGSLMASPIVSDFGTVGVLEVLSPHPREFTKAQGMVLDQLVAMIPKLYNRRAQSEPGASETPVEEEAPETATSLASRLDPTPPRLSKSESIPAMRRALVDEKTEPENEIQEQVAQQVSEENLETASASERPARLLYRALLGLSLAVALAALGYAFGPVVKKWAESPPEARWSFLKPVKAVNVAEASSAVSGKTTGLRPAASRSVDSGAVDHDPIDSGSVGRYPQPKSLQELQELADAGDPDAQWQMGVRCHDGEGVPQDDARAVQWFRLAAEQGNVAAQGALGAYYWRGRGVPADLSKAYLWSTIAMAQGDEMSKSRIEGLSSQMTRVQISVARQQAEDWMRAHNRESPSTPN